MPATTSARDRLIEIVRARSFSTGSQTKLASGRSSNFYFDMKPTMLYRKGALPQLYRRDEEVTDKTTRRWKPLDGSTLESPTTEAVTAARAAVVRHQAKAARRLERPWLMVLLLVLAASFLAWVLSRA